ncbi:MAG: UMP kinase [Methanolinea sp.]|jgi:uridylate kinase|nr:UMP kinase [Methanolinea sp.]
MTRVVLSLGGSILFPSLEAHTLRTWAPVLTRVAGCVELFVVVGGGGEARRYIQAARDTGADEAFCDEVGILVTRLNAALLIGALMNAAYPRVALTPGEAMEYSGRGKIVVMGGVTPAQTTDAVAAVLAERAGADLLVNLTSVDGIYTADPKKDKKARRFSRMPPQQLLEIVSGCGLEAGSNTVVDMVAAKVVQRSSIPLLVLDGRDPELLEAALFSTGDAGTMVIGEGKNPLPLQKTHLP